MPPSATTPLICKDLSISRRTGVWCYSRAAWCCSIFPAPHVAPGRPKSRAQQGRQQPSFHGGPYRCPANGGRDFGAVDWILVRVLGPQAAAARRLRHRSGARAALHVGLRSSPDDGGPIAGWSDGRGCNGVDDPCGHRPHDRHGPLQFGAGGPRHDHWHGGGRQYRLGLCSPAAIRGTRTISADGCDDHRWCRPDLGVPAGNQACQIPRLIAGSLAFGTTAVVVTGEGAWRAPYEATRSNVSYPTQSRNCRNQLRQSAFSSHDRSALSACDRVSLWSETPDRRDRGLLLHKEGSASASFLPAGNTALCRSPRRMMYEKTIQAA